MRMQHAGDIQPTLRPGSTGGLALQHLRVHGPTSLPALARALDKPEDELDSMLGFPVREGLIVRRMFNGVAQFDVGHGGSRPGGVDIDAAHRTAQAQVAPAQKVPTFSKRAAAAAAERVTTVAPAPIAPTVQPDVDRGRAPASNDGADALGVALEAASLAGVDVDDLAVPGAHMHAARELLSAAAPALEVKRFDCARFAGGRLVLELDGLLYVLPPKFTNSLHDYLDGHVDRKEVTRS